MAAKVAPDRLRVSHMRLWSLAALTAVMVWAALSSLPTAGGRGGLSSGMTTQAAILVAVLAVFGLRSIPVRRVVRAMALISGLLLARFGQLSATEGLSGSWKVMAWIASCSIALVLAPSSRPVPRGHGETDVEIESGGRSRVPVAITIGVVTLVLGSALLIGPRASNWFPVGSSAGELIDRRGDRSDNVLAARESLDMTSRPRLSDKVVMTVRSPIVSFWRAEIFDTWDGSTWFRSYGRAGNMLVGGRATPSPDDLAAFRGNQTVQEFRLETGFATVLAAAPSPVHVDAVNDVAQRVDGTLLSPFQPAGRGFTYTVTSRQMPLHPDRLRLEPRAADAAANDSVAAMVIGQYAQPPVVTDRVAALAQRATADASSDFERVVALEDWMGDNTTYSLDAPLSPKGVDVVDHFLFDSREGWCEQIASSLVVMARSVGIPARLVTGYAPGEWDSTGGRFVVRERDAHAWAEVWFPESGWVPFDPTASVPLAGTDEASAGATARDWREVLGAVLLIIGLVTVGAGPLMRLVQRVTASLRRRRELRREIADRWEVRAGRQLERIGADAGRPREPADTLTSYGAVVADRVDEPDLARVGEVLDRVTYARRSAAVGSPGGGVQGEGVGGGDTRAHDGRNSGAERVVMGDVDDPDRRLVEAILTAVSNNRGETDG